MVPHDQLFAGIPPAFSPTLDFPTSCATMSYIMSTLTIRIPDDLRRELQRLSRQQDRPVSEVVRDSLRRYLAAERFRALRKKTLPFAEAQGFLTDDDVFKAIS